MRRPYLARLRAAFAAAFALFALLPASAHAQTRAASSDPAAVVTALYRDHFAGEKSWERTVERNRALFAPELLALLDEDARRQAANPEELVGLDFDPLTNAQDDATKYVVGKTTRDAEGAVVEVAVYFGTEPMRLRVRLVESGGRWLVANVLYGESDLVSILREAE